MRCGRCKGSGEIGYPPQFVEVQPVGSMFVRKVMTHRGLIVPCPDCGGSGIGHCCDGICEQPAGDQ